MGSLFILTIEGTLLLHPGFTIGRWVGSAVSKFRQRVMSRVLVVEDSVTQREMITDLLKGSGLSVSIATDGVEALEHIEGHRPDLVVLDIVMPRMNGYEVCRRIKADPKTQNVPVVMCSSKGEEFDRYWGMKQGADAYIAKPFQPTELVGTVKQLLRG
jgi:twitching motility two-component system response regulator PilH